MTGAALLVIGVLAGILPLPFVLGWFIMAEVLHAWCTRPPRRELAR
jgi:hypothetical protein